MLSTTQIELIEEHLRHTKQRVIVIDIAGEKIVIKRQESARSTLLYTMLKWTSTAFRLPVLHPAYAPGGAAAQKIEVTRLTQLREFGVPVPKILHVATDWFAISFVGEHSIGWLMLNGNLAPSIYWEQGLAAISAVHQKGQNLSQVFVRNAVWHENTVSFIDFEDDPAASLGLAYAQARDWLFYLFSSVWMLEITHREAAKIALKYINKDTIEVRDVLLGSMRSISWLRFLPAKRKPWGRDVVALRGAGMISHEMRSLNLMRAV